MTEAPPDTVRAFTEALSPAARHHLHLNYEAIRCVTVACQRIPPTELAHIVSVGIGWHTPANASALLSYRLHREAFGDEEQPEEID